MLLKLTRVNYLLGWNKIHPKMYSSSTSNEIEFKTVNQIGCIILNRPKQLNAINSSMVRTIAEKIKECESDKRVKAILIKGAGEKAFCAGGDVKSVREKILQGNNKEALDFFKQEYKLNNMIANCKKPYVALISGITMGGGVGLSIHGKYRVATEKTLFAMPETAIGFFADVGGSYFLPRLRDHIGIYLALTGSRLKGQDVKSTGIATHFVNSSKLTNLEEVLYNEQNLDEIKLKHILNSFEEPVTKEFNTEKISKLFNESSLEKIFENLEKDNSDWSKQQLKLLNKMSPLSLKITVRQLSLGSKMCLQECLTMEYQLGQRFAKDGDFVEGVRSLLIDKDDNPRWNPSSYKDIDEKRIDWFFNPQPDDEKLVLND